MSNYTPQLIADICHRYKKLRQSAREIVENLPSLIQDDVYEILRREGIPRDLPGGSPATDPKIVAAMINDYVVNRIGANTVGEKYGVSKKTVYNHVIKAGHKLRPRSNRLGEATSVPVGILAGITPTGRKRGSGRTQQLALNAQAFDTLTPAAAYWIGYVLCDGCVVRPKARTNSRLFLNQGICHLEHLELFKAFIGAFNKISKGTHLDPAGVEQEHCVLQVTSSALCLALAKYGMFGLKPERSAADSRLLLNRDFWRGCMDADGCVYGNNKLYLSGHDPLLNQWDAAVRALGAETPTRITQPGCSRATSCGNNARTITSWLYYEGAVALPDKVARSKIPAP